MKLIVDASVAIKWVILEDGHAAARQLLVDDHELISPDFLLVEAASVLWKKVRYKELMADQVGSKLSAVAWPLHQLVRTDAHIARALHLAVELDHPVYDCLYLAVAEAERAVVVTADNRLLRSLAGSRHGELAVSMDHLE